LAQDYRSWEAASVADTKTDLARRRKVGASRRQFLASAPLAAAAVLAGSPWTSRPAKAEDTLNLLTWPGHGDPKFVGPFEKQYGVHVRVKDYVGGEQMLAAVNAAPIGTYDAVLTDREYIPQLRAADKIVELDPADYPFSDFFPEVQKVPNHWDGNKLYSVLVRFMYLGLAYNSDKVTKEEAESYSLLWNPKIAKKVGWFDWYLPSMGCLSLRAGNHPSPFDIGNEQFSKLKESLFSLKPQTAGFYAFSGLFSQFANGSIYVCAGIGDWLTQPLKSQGSPIESAIPKEGALGVAESISILKGARRPDLATKFIQYATSPEGQVRTALLPAYVNYIPSMKGWDLLAKQSPDWATRLRMQFDQYPNVIDDFKANKITWRQTPKQQPVAAWNRAWTEFKYL
jgi:spermidine/putrescine transport system substrate-binding protein